MARSTSLLRVPNAIALLASAPLLLFASASHALTFTIGASDSGWYDDSGGHTASNQNYSAGWEDTELRNFFVFDLSGLPIGETVLSATLRAYNPAVGEPDVTFGGGYASPDASETYNLSGVTTPAAVVTATSVGDIATYNDLGDGPVYGSYAASSADNGEFIEIVLNASGVAAVDGAVGDFVIGGFESSLTSAFGTTEVVFGHTDPPGLGPYTRELVVTVTPEPGTGLLMALGLITLGAAQRRRAGSRG